MTRELKHTPGPWAVDLNRDFTLGGDTVSIEAITPCGKYVRREVASCMLDTDESPYGEEWLEDTANARLIAQSPALLSLLIDYESWEGDLIMSNEAWGKDGMNPLPTFTQELFDRFLELQRRRNEIIKAITG